jgi:hypothetical protein
MEASAVQALFDLPTRVPNRQELASRDDPVLGPNSSPGGCVTC